MVRFEVLWPHSPAGVSEAILALYAGDLLKVSKTFEHVSQYHSHINLVAKHLGFSLPAMNSLSVTGFHHFLNFPVNFLD